MANSIRATRFTGAGAVFCLAVLVAAGRSPAGAQSAVPAHQEPRHRLVFESDEFRVLDIQIQPGDTTLFHRHDTPITYVSIDASTVDQQVLGEPWRGVTLPERPPQQRPGRVTWNEAYAARPVEHRVTALGPGRFRLIGVVHRGSGASSEGSPTLGSVGPPDRAGSWFRSANRTLEPGEALDWAAHDRPVVIVQVSGGRLAVEPPAARDDSGTAGLGDFLVLESGLSYRLVGGPDRAVSLAFVEVR